MQLGEVTLVCRFKKKLYDLKQVAPCNGTSSFTHFYIKEYNLVTNEVDLCVYHNQGVMETICAIFVDDGILCVVKEQEAHNI